MRRKIVHPFGQTVSGFRLVSMLTAVFVLWMFYHRLRDPATWRDFVDAKEDPVVLKENAEALREELETIVPGPNDQDESEVEAIQDQFELVTDRTALKWREMGAYWRLLGWSSTQPFFELEKRASVDVPFTQLWERPERYRGKLIRLQLHIRRVLKHDESENPTDAKAENPPDTKEVYEAWGPTDESRSFPYVIVFRDLPQGLPVGTDVRAEVVFVGYFLKIMTYTAFEHVRGAPLLLGRVKLVSAPRVEATANLDWWVIPLIVAGGTVFIGLTIWTGKRSRKKSKVSMLPTAFSSLDISESPGFDNLFGQIDTIPQAAPKVETPILDVVNRPMEHAPSASDAKPD